MARFGDLGEFAHLGWLKAGGALVLPGSALSCLLLKRADQLDCHSEPRRIGDNLLATTRFQRKDLQFLMVSIDQAAEEKTAGGTRNEDVAVQRARKIARLQRIAP